MYRNIALLVLMSLLFAACASAPWNKNSAPPVELLDEKEAAAVDQKLASESAPTVTSSNLPADSASTSTNTGPAPGKQRFKDVPLPANVKEDAERTYVYESSTIQVGRMVYTSKETPNDLAQFYIQESQNIGWKLDNVLQADGVQLAFSKPGKKLAVSIRPQGIGRPQLLIVTLTPAE